VVLGLSHRARSLFRAVAYLATGPAAVVTPVAIRPLTEIHLALRFLALNPELHTELWIAEQTRWQVSFAEAVRDREELKPWRAQLHTELIDPRRAEVRRLRDEAIAAGVPGVGKSGPLFPSIKRQVEALNDSEAWQTYYFVYGRLGADVHAGLLSFEHVRLKDVQDGFAVHREEATEDDFDAERAVSITTFASILISASRALELEIADRADQIRLHFINWRGDGSQLGGNAS
jgi:hypothetical protein